MKLGIYQEAVKRTLPSLGDKYLSSLTGIISEDFIKELGLKLDLAHMALGKASELSELEGCLTSGKFDPVNLDEELGDKLWYAVNWANLLNIKLDVNKINEIWEAKSYDSSTELIIYGGQLADIAKRFLAYGATLEQQEEKRKKGKNYLSNEEILYNYIASIYEMSDIHGRDFEKIMGKNITKLYVRYPDKFSEDSALLRDLEAERIVLENEDVK